MSSVCSTSYTPNQANYTASDGGECYVESQNSYTPETNAVYDAGEVADAIRNHIVKGHTARNIWDEVKEFGGNILDRVEDTVKDWSDQLNNHFDDPNSY
jgi:hypothetical protein